MATNKRPSKQQSAISRSRPRACQLAPLCLVLAFQLAASLLLAPAYEAIQAPAEQQAAAAAEALAKPPMVSYGSESSSALESAAGDDLIAAESNQTPENQAAEHKAFTAGQPMRQDQAQMSTVSVAPVFGGAVPQQAPFGLHPQQMLQARVVHQPLGGPHQPQPPKGFNSFMQAALAGTYGPAQQQIAAAAAASVQAHQSRGQIPVHGHMPPPLPGYQRHPPQQVHHHGAGQIPGGMHMGGPQQQPAVQQQQQQQQQQPPRQQQEPQISAEQRRPAPEAYSPMVDANSIEMSDSTAIGTQLATASSAQHPVVAAGSSQETGSWPLQAPEIPKILNLEVKCEKNLMKVSIEFDKVFNGVIFSKGHFSQGQCLHVGQNSGKQQAYFDISINSCGTQGNTQNGLYGLGGNTGSGTYFENTIVIQYDPNVQEVYDHARKLRCTWHDQYEKAVTFRPFPVDMMDIVRADFAGDNVGCWMQIQVGKGPWASEVAGIVKIGQTMTMVLAIKDEENKFDMLVRNCFAHDGKRGPIELVDKSGCITRPKLMSRFTKIKNFGSSATVLSYAHFQAFKFPDSMEVHFQCTIQICRHQCPEQCSSSSGNPLLGGPNQAAGQSEAYSESTISGTFNIGAGQEQAAGVRKQGALSRERRDLHAHHQGSQEEPASSKQVGLNRMIQVVSSGDLAFALGQQANASALGDAAWPTAAQLTRQELAQHVCMSSFNFVLGLVLLTLVLLCSTLLGASFYLRHRSLAKGRAPANKLAAQIKQTPTKQVPQQQQQYYSNPLIDYETRAHH